MQKGTAVNAHACGRRRELAHARYTQVEASARLRAVPADFRGFKRFYPTHRMPGYNLHSKNPF